MMMMMMSKEEDVSKYAVGYRIDPFDHELIDGYLKPVILGKPLSCNTIQFRQVYGPSSHPWLVFHPSDPSWLSSPHLKTSEKFMYVFAKLSKLSKNTSSKNTSKTAGCGTWVGRTKRDKIRDDQGDVIGEKRYLVYEIQDTDSTKQGVGLDLRQIGTYRMHEYSLTGINKRLNSADPVVICKVIRDSSKPCQITKIVGSKLSAKVSKTKSSSRRVKKKQGIASVTEEALIDGCVGDWSVATQFNNVEKKEETSNNMEGNGSVTTENPTVIDVGVGEWSNATRFNNGDQELDEFCQNWRFDDSGSEGDQEPCLDVEWLTRILESDQQEGPVEDSIVLGKRKYEEEGSSCCTKKMCF